MPLFRPPRQFPVLTLPGLVLILVLSAGGTAFAQHNTFVASNNAAGQASQTVTGYTIASPSYSLNPINPVNIDSVTFTAAGTVKPGQAWLKLSSSYKSCVISGSASPWTVTCGSAGNPLGEAVNTTTTFDAVVAQ